ncbi:MULTISPECIES: ammonium transporter [Hyphomicrobium]|uniref:ammonium transporter n=1 Tax=Hyphomicrobium TaxID=81 RepID=UPI0003815578|nr:MULTISPECIES: ammonium transporter [Hyphomicrobium]WBT39997.1 ammonium transporter [Hyphomicrobium sp. DMF-1]
MADQATAMTTLFTEFYFFLCIVLMFFIHIGFCMYEVGVARTKNVQHTLLKNAMAIPTIGIAFYLFGMWIYIALQSWPIGSSEVSFSTGFEPWSKTLAPNLADRISGVFLGAFMLFGMTAGSIVSGSIIERSKTIGFLIIAVYIGAIAWVVPAAWAWAGNGWMVQYLGYHDQYCSAILHSVAGFGALAVLLNLGPRIGKFDANGEPREIPAHNPWMVTLGLFMIYVGFFGFYAACHIPIVNIAAEGQPEYWTATNIYGFPITLSGVTMNFLLALLAGMMTAYMVSGGNAFWTFSGGLTGLISASSGNDLYHPVVAATLAVVGTAFGYYMHNWVEKKYKLDDAVGAVAVHGYCGVFGGIAAGFLLWGYPAINPSAGTLVALSEGAGWFGTNAEGIPIITPIGNTIGTLVFAIGFGFIPTYVIAKVLKSFGMLRVDPKVELTGLDGDSKSTTYPNLSGAEAAFEALQRKEAKA